MVLLRLLLSINSHTLIHMYIRVCGLRFNTYDLIIGIETCMGGGGESDNLQRI